MVKQAMSRKYRVSYKRDRDGWWVATVHGVKGVHTQGRTIRDAKHRIREALALAIGDRAADKAELKDEVKLPALTRRVLEEIGEQKARAEAAKEKTAELIIKAYKLLKQHGLSMRDVGALTGLSHQRVHQLSKKPEAHA